MKTHSNSLYYLFAITAGAVLLPELVQAAQSIDTAAINEAAQMASDTIEIMAKAASTATDTANASGTPILDQLLGQNGTFLLGTLGGGGIAGWCVGFTLKKVAKVVAIFLGVTFVTLQYLAYKNLITIDWGKFQSAVDKQYLEQAGEGLMGFLTYNLPFAGSFLVGFWLGFRKG